MRPIDADELKKKSRCIEFGETGRMSAKNWVVSELDINKSPTIEMPVKQGKWVEERRCYSTKYYCSACGSSALYNEDSLGYPKDYFLTDFCPYCGAEMGSNN